MVKCVSADVEGNAVLGVEIEKRHGHLDTVIANAGKSMAFSIYFTRQKLNSTTTLGICDSSNLVSEINPANLDQHFRVRLYSTFSTIIQRSVSIALPGQRHGNYRPIPSGVRPSQEERLAALHTDRLRRCLS